MGQAPKKNKTFQTEVKLKKPKQRLTVFMYITDNLLICLLVIAAESTPYKNLLKQLC